MQNFHNSLGTLVFNPRVPWTQLKNGPIYLGNKIDPLWNWNLGIVKALLNFYNSIGTLVFNPWFPWIQLKHGPIYLGNKIDSL
jgi:hypothetical protein